jgi:hypothetical protein
MEKQVDKWYGKLVMDKWLNNNIAQFLAYKELEIKGRIAKAIEKNSRHRIDSFEKFCIISNDQHISLEEYHMKRLKLFK